MPLPLLAAACSPPPGVVNVDSFTFDKLMGKMPTLIHFKRPYWQTKHAEAEEGFAALAEVVSASPGGSKILLAEVGVAGSARRRCDLVQNARPAKAPAAAAVATSAVDE